MNQQYPQQPNQPNQPQQPGYGHPQQPGYGYPPQPGYPGGPAPQPPKKNNVGKIIGLGCGGILALVLLIGIIGAVAGGGDDSDSGKKEEAGASTAASPKSKEEKPAAKEESAPEKEEEPAPQEGPVKVTAKKTAFTGSILADGTDYTSVLVTVTNSGDEAADVNPLYFTITDTAGTKHTAELAADENQIDTVTLAPGENISGTVTGKGTFTPKYVTFTDGLLGDPIRADVS